MQWTAEAIVTGVRRHGETSAILEMLTRERGRSLGLVRGGRSRRLRAVLQPGNTVLATWRARLDEHLGAVTIEPIAERAAALMGSAASAYATEIAAAYVRLLPERDPHPRLYDALAALLDHQAEPKRAAELLARFEMLLLDELGAGLDLTACAATGVSDDLVFVSPRSGRSVSREAGAPYADRLLRLPAFLAEPPDPASPPSDDQLRDAFALTGFFLAKNVLEPRGEALPDLRAAYMAAAGLDPAARKGSPTAVS